MSNIEQFKSSFTITSEQFKSADMGQLKELTTNYADDGIKSYEWGYDGKPDSSGKLIHTIVGKLEYDFLGAYDKLQKLANSGDKIAMADLYDKWYDSTKISLRSKPTSLARLAIGQKSYTYFGNLPKKSLTRTYSPTDHALRSKI